MIVSGVCGSFIMPVSLKAAKRVIGRRIAIADAVNHLLVGKTKRLSPTTYITNLLKKKLLKDSSRKTFEQGWKFRSVLAWLFQRSLLSRVARQPLYTSAHLPSGQSSTLPT